MPYGFLYDVPVDEAMYRQVRAELGDEPPAGLIAHVVVEHGAGLRYIDVWDSRADWERFREQRVEPAVDKMLADHGVTTRPAHPVVQEIAVVDVWLGA